MLEFEELTWTSRAEVRERLYQFLRETPPTAGPNAAAGQDRPSRRARAAALWGLLAEAPQVAHLRDLLLNRHEEQEVRLAALGALTRMEVTLPAAGLMPLLAERAPPGSAAPDAGDSLLQFRRDWDGAPDLAAVELLELARPEDTPQVIRTSLEGWSAEERAHVLLGLHWYVHSVAPAVQEWLYERWLSHDREQVEDVRDDEEVLLNHDIADMTAQRDESWALLLDYWRRSRGEQRGRLVRDLQRFGERLAEAVADNAAEKRELAGKLALPVPVLVDYYGAASLLRLLESRIETATTELDLGGLISPRLIGDDFDRVESVLREWPDPRVNELLLRLMHNPTLPRAMRAFLLEIVWARDRSRALEVARAEAAGPAGHRIVAAILTRIWLDLRATDVDFLRWTVGQADPHWRHRGLLLLERLGEDSAAWRKRLDELSEDRDPLVRLQALAARARRGDEASVAPLVHTAVRATDVLLRAVAIRLLGELSPAPRMALFQQALLYDLEECDNHAPAAEEAAFALARLGTPPALTSLIQSYLAADNPHLRFAVGSYLAVLVARLEGREVPLENVDSDWALCRRWSSD